MILVLTAMSIDQERLVREALLNRRLDVELAIHRIQPMIGEELLGRDAVAHQGRYHAQQGLQHIPTAMIGLGLSAGIDMTPEGVFLICVAVSLARSGRLIAGWSTPRLIPDTVGRALAKGGSLEQLMENYRQQWQPVDVFSRIDIDELIDRQASYAEAVNETLDAQFHAH